MNIRVRSRRVGNGRGSRSFSSLELSAVGFFVILQFIILDFFQLNNNGLMLIDLSKSPNLLHEQSTNVMAQRETEMAQALQYVESFQSFDRKIKFFHIPKTAGTSIEQTAAENGIAWGGCAFKHVPKRKICPHPPGEEWPRNVGWWHLPSQFFPLSQSDPYQEAELFGVIRSPFNRLVSEFYYLCTLRVKEWRPSVCDRTRIYDPVYMNSWLRDHLSQEEELAALRYLVHNSHFTSHFDYVIAPHEVRMLDYVLRMDDPYEFNSDFAKLMKAFDLPLKLREMQSIGSHGKETLGVSQGKNSSAVAGDTKLTISDLTNDTIAIIASKFRDDLEYFGYALEKDE